MYLHRELDYLSAFVYVCVWTGLTELNYRKEKKIWLWRGFVQNKSWTTNSMLWAFYCIKARKEIKKEISTIQYGLIPWSSDTLHMVHKTWQWQNLWARNPARKNKTYSEKWKRQTNKSSRSMLQEMYKVYTKAWQIYFTINGIIYLFIYFAECQVYFYYHVNVNTKLVFNRVGVARSLWILQHWVLNSV